MKKTGLGIQELLYYERSQILAIAQKHGAYNMRVFGSVARGEATQESDIDLLVDYYARKNYALVSRWAIASFRTTTQSQGRYHRAWIC
jgi:predicted nucleotidyltransferase